MYKVNKYDEQRDIEMATQLQEIIRQQQAQIQELGEQLKQIQQATPTTSQNNINIHEKAYRRIKHITPFTGQGEISINSFINQIEYYLLEENDDSLKKEIIRCIFFEKIQGEAKSTIINIPNPTSWIDIKATLKARYRPEIEPAEIYKKISSMKANTVSDLTNIVLDIKYKSDEISKYYKEDNCIDLSNVDSLLINTIKNMTQGVLLDKIYEERDLLKIINIMRSRRFEDSCIREEEKIHVKTDNNKFQRNRNFGKFSNNYQENKTHNRYNRYSNNYNNNINHSHENNKNYNNTYNNNKNDTKSYNNNHNNYNNNNYNRNFQKQYPTSGHSRIQSGQNRHQQTNSGQRRIEPMEVDNIEMIRYNRENKENNINDTRIEQNNNVENERKLAFFMN